MIQAQTLFPNSVSVRVGTDGVIVSGTSQVGIQQSNIGKTGTGVYTFDVGFNAAMGEVAVTPFSTDTLPTITTWTLNIITVTTRNYAGAAADGAFQLTARRNTNLAP